MKNKILSMMLCAALIFTMLATPQIQPPAHAEAVALTATVIAVAVTLIVAAGVTWTSVAMGKQCTTQFLTDKPEAKQIIQDIVAAMPQTGVLVLTKTMLPKVKEFMKMVGEYFKGKFSVMVPSHTLKAIGDLEFTTLSASELCDYETVHKYCLYNADDIAVAGLSFFINGSSYKIQYNNDCGLAFIKDGKTYNFSYICQDTGSMRYLTGPCRFPSGTRELIEHKFGFRLVNVNGNMCIEPFTCTRYKCIDDVHLNTHYESFYEVPADRSFYSYINLTDPYNDVSEGVPVDTINIGNIDDVNEAIAHSVGQAAEGVKVDIQKLIEEIEAAKEDALPWTVEGIRELIGIQDELREIAREQERIKDAIKEGTKEDDMDVPQLPTTITEKFPFCVPFDLIALAKTFSAEPVAPKVTIPVVFESMHYSHDFVFDFSGDNWDKVAAVIRWGTLIFFILGLTLVTRKLIKG